MHTWAACGVAFPVPEARAAVAAAKPRGAPFVVPTLCTRRRRDCLLIQQPIQLAPPSLAL